MAEKDKGTNARLKLEITEVSEPKDIGRDNRVWMMLEFKAQLEDADKAHTYKAFIEKFFEHIKKGETIDADINITTNTVERDGEPVTYTNRKVTQIYIDSQPVNVKQSGSGYREDSPQKIASIETQTAVKTMVGAYGQIEAAGIAKGVAPKYTPFVAKIINNALTWCNTRIPADDAPKAPQPVPQPPQTPSKDKAEDNLMDLPIKNLGDLFTACQKHFKLTQSNTLKELGLTAKEEIADVQDAWRQIVSARI